MMGGSSQHLYLMLYSNIRKTLKGKGIKTSAITSVAGMTTHRIMIV